MSSLTFWEELEKISLIYSAEFTVTMQRYNVHEIRKINQA